MLDWSCRDMLKNNPGFSPMRKEPVRTPYFGAGLVFSRVPSHPFELFNPLARRLESLPPP